MRAMPSIPGSDAAPAPAHALQALERRIGHAYVQRRLAQEHARDAWHTRRGAVGAQPDRWNSKAGLIRAALNLSGLRARGLRNTLDIRQRDNMVRLRRLPSAFDGYTVLHLSDLHLDINTVFVHRLVERLQGLRYDACVLTGDFRFRSFGSSDGVLAALALLRPHLGERVYAVLGNHDSIRMVPGMEALGMQVLVNESAQLRLGAHSVSLVGIDDPRYFRTHDFERATAGLDAQACSILLSHAPEPYREAAHANFDLMLCGHTHGGQICLPGGRPILTDSAAPGAFARGAWRYRTMHGYTSVGCGSSIIDVRFNCPPEITLHRLHAAT